MKKILRAAGSGWRVMAAIFILSGLAWASLAGQTPVTLPFVEDFEHPDWAARGWYDGVDFTTTPLVHLPNSVQSLLWDWKKTGDVGPGGHGGRLLIEPSEGITFSFLIRLSDSWKWSGVGYAPHMFHFLTDQNDMYVGPAYTHLTVYVELVDGRLRFALQDGQNIDMSHLNQDLTKVTENRAVAGGNGDSDGYGGKAYDAGGGMYWNGKYWNSDTLCFSDSAGPYYKGDWHRIKVHFQLNSVVDGKGINNGVIRAWFDDRPMMDYENVLFRTGRFPQMKINQFMVAPYFGTGVKNPQTAWLDDLKIEREEETHPALAPKSEDIDGDGRLGLLDVVSFILASRRNPQDMRLDRNADGCVNVFDAWTLLRQIYGLKQA